MKEKSGTGFQGAERLVQPPAVQLAQPKRMNPWLGAY